MTNDPSTTYTLDDFIDMKFVDDMTYYKFSILENINGVHHLDHNLIEDYLPELNKICTEVHLNDEQYKRYKYRPDLLAYDLYKSIQLDFVILLINDMIDPKEFTKKVIKLPYASVLKKFLSTIYSSEQEYIQQNRAANNIMN